MRNVNYSPPIRYAFIKPNYNYQNIININPQTYLYHQKFQKSESLSRLNLLNIGNNNYNKSFINPRIVPPHTPYLTRNYSSSNENLQKLNLNQLYMTNNHITDNIPIPHNSHMNLNYNNLYSNVITNTNTNSNTSKNLNNINNVNNNNINNNINNSVYSIIKKNNNGTNNIFYSPQKLNTHNQNINLYLKQSKSNQKLNYINSITPIININNINNTNNININSNKNLNNTNTSTNRIINITPNLNISHNYSQKYLKTNYNNTKLDSIKKALLLDNQLNSLHNKDKTETSKNLNNHVNINNNRTTKSDEIIKISMKKEKEEDPKENFEPNEFIIIKRIGEGTYGKIYLTQWKKNGKKYAMKKEIIKGSESLKKNREKTKIVTNFIKKTGCKGVIKIYGDLYKKKGNEYYYYVLMEIAERDWEKELFERQKYKKYYSEKELFLIMNQLIKTLSLLQKNHITHRDIKPQNVLVNKGIYKISDFGEARTLLREGIIVSRVRGTELYMSPILFNGLKLKLIQISHNTFKSDVFSLGMCLFLASTLTFNSLCDIRELSDMKLVKEILMKYLSGKYSLKFINILVEMLQIEENNRPDFITLEKKCFS